jgi:hypothetical protein
LHAVIAHGKLKDYRDNDMVSVFLCHSSEDKPFVRMLASHLRNSGVKVWLDEAEIRVGESLIGRIGTALDSVDFVAVVLSANSIKSEWVERELHVALNREFRERKVVVLPILLHKVVIPPFLRDKLYADFSNPDRFEEGFRLLLSALGVSQEHLSLLQRQNFKFHKLHHFIAIKDVQGHLAVWRKETTVTPLYPGITLWRDEQFHATGKLRFIGSEPGVIDKTIQDGGNLTVVTRFEKPLEKGVALVKALDIEVLDGACNPEEDFSWLLMGDFEEFGIHLTVPIERPFKEPPQVCYMLSTQECQIPTVSISEEMNAVNFLVRPPIQGAKYVVRWKW